MARFDSRGEALFARYIGYLGWTNAGVHDKIGTRVRAERGNRSYLILASRDRFRYSAYESGELVRAVVDDGITVEVISVGRTTAVDACAAMVIRAEVALLTNDFARYGSRCAIADDVVELRSNDGSWLQLDLHPDGSLRSARAGVPPLGQALVPLAIAPLSADHRVYSSWRRNREPTIRICSFDPHARVYPAEFVVSRKAAS